MVLEIRSGPAAGRSIAIAPGQSVTVGRTARADAGFPEDNHMSGLHFVVVSDAANCTLRDLRSSNGAFLNGARVDSAPLRHGDTVMAGDTTFSVHIAAEEAAVTVVKPAAPPREGMPQARLLAILRQDFPPLYWV